MTFVFALMAVPISGAFCPDGCIEYPYLETRSHYPKDYVWMFLAIPLVLTYLIFVVSLHFRAMERNQIYTYVGLTMAVISAVVLLACYYIQFSVVPASLINGETEGIAILTQYNPHGIFIALEELGYLVMSFSFVFLVPAFTTNNLLEKFIRWIFITAFAFTVLSFIIISIKYGIVKKDRFEVLVISIDWLVLILNGILASIVFKRSL